MTAVERLLTLTTYSTRQATVLIIINIINSKFTFLTINPIVFGKDMIEHELMKNLNKIFNFICHSLAY